MEKEGIDFLQRYMETVSPSGFEEEATCLWRAEADRFAERTWVDTHGNAFAVINEGGSPRVMLAGHADEIGLMISYIDDKGYLSFLGIGGWDPQILPGQRVRIQGKGGPLLGVIGRKPIHLLQEEERKKVVKMENLWIDIGAKDKKEAAELVEIGDPVVLDYGFAKLRNDLLVARGFDDRIGAFVVLEAARLLATMAPRAAVYAVATVQEEVGLRGARTSAFGINPHVGIAVDVGHASDTPDMGTEKKKVGDIAMGKGPIIARGPNINPQLFRIFVNIAKEKEIPYQIDAAPHGTGTDANAIQLTRAGVATGLISIPNRYMHSPCEMVHMGDLEQASQLIAHVVATIDADTDFIPA
ncbi:M42 family metallopeptidase [Candidatus Acetothermia bacterium]|jgi:endoglucanase|nr:M42 family metallopeptidase [Candidatus Acetothermia bacterium]MCI2426866.1 M42 family metallopeptidase [Candidatus Acetothermia bacterium]MCI2427954.1 M42 family metallopeptidase [Candidatus Acetothermia bacterium]